jgi:hypothetical protein
MPNEFYDHTTFPSQGSVASSAAMRAELDAIETGFDKMPVLTGNNGKTVKVNASGTGLEAVTVGSISVTSGILKGDGVGGTIVAVADADYATPSLVTTNVNAHINDSVDAHDASAISFVAVGNIAATDVQNAIQELDTEKVPRTAATGSVVVPTGTTGERDGSPQTGYLRFNSTTQQFEGYFNGAWQSVGGGQLLGNALTKGIFYNSQTIAENLTIASGTNGGTFGPVTISDGFTVTISDGCVWTIV